MVEWRDFEDETSLIYKNIVQFKRRKGRKWKKRQGMGCRVFVRAGSGKANKTKHVKLIAKKYRRRNAMCA